MGTSMPELGSKISLISKADIRYEGRLFTVDPQECTIALANVRSFGTEDRETQFPVAPQNQVYEYILFRGSDIKDIRVVNAINSLPNDPAIVQMTMPPSISQQSYQQPPPPHLHSGYMMTPMGPMAQQPGYPYNPMAQLTMGPSAPMGMQRAPLSKQSSELSLGPGEGPAITIHNSQHIERAKGRSLEDGMMDLISGGSRSTTPTSLMARKSPTMDQSIQAGHQQSNIGKIGDKASGRNAQQQHRERERSHGTGRTGSGMSQYSDGKRDGPKQQNQDHGQGPHPGAGRGGQRGGWVNRGNMRGRGRGGRGGPIGPGANFRNPPPAQKKTLKFENDYDFEQANTQFEELRSQLAKTKIDTGVENEKKDDSGNETGVGEGEPEEDSEVIHYDKAKSFFDNISCEAVERSKGRSQRTDWRTERKLNSETFGVSSTRRGNYRGRGYYNRGMGGMYRGGGGPGGPGGGPPGVNFRGFRGGPRGRKPIQMGPGPGPNNQNREPQSQQNNRLVSGTA